MNETFYLLRPTVISLEDSHMLGGYISRPILLAPGLISKKVYDALEDKSLAIKCPLTRLEKIIYGIE
jgi:hypothetical protein